MKEEAFRLTKNRVNNDLCFELIFFCCRTCNVQRINCYHRNYLAYVNEKWCYTFFSIFVFCVNNVFYSEELIMINDNNEILQNYILT